MFGAFLITLNNVLVTLIGEAVFARCLSAIKDERVRASKIISGPQKETFRGDKQQFIDDLEQALYASKIISYAQGFQLMQEVRKRPYHICLSCGVILPRFTDPWNNRLRANTSGS